ncbi:hypothetical protein TIFTF001_044332 [Ficus carica]|uniref:DYW domain-containing protein n=1 Tax=Ficus carica TaxID=3494 RepID=A0AA87Z3I6_FICCA|nr:hypothetical protein TIFTF001_044332 [Ficus carica]
MNKRGLVKPPGSSKIEINGKIHEFIVGDSSHPEAEEIYSKLDEIEEKLREERYQPKLSEVLLEIDDEEKAFQLSHHSEKLALAFGLIKTSPGSEIRIAKNLRSCEDCHAFMKKTSLNLLLTSRKGRHICLTYREERYTESENVMRKNPQKHA